MRWCRRRRAGRFRSAGRRARAAAPPRRAGPTALAPNAKLRPLVEPQRPLEQEVPATEIAAASEREVETVQARLGRISWARLLKRGNRTARFRQWIAANQGFQCEGDSPSAQSAPASRYPRASDSFLSPKMGGRESAWGRYCEFAPSGSSHWAGGAGRDAAGWQLNPTLPPLWPGRGPRRATAWSRGA